MSRIALLRGVNVGGHRRMPMAELRSTLGAAGFADVRTYIQSGNVVFGGGPTDDEQAAGAIGDAIQARFGFDVPVCVRSVDHLRAALARSHDLFLPDDPQSRAAESPHDKRVHIGFCSVQPDAGNAAALDGNRSPGDVAIVDGREVHVFYAVGAGSTKLTIAVLERTLETSITARNLRTVSALLDLAG